MKKTLSLILVLVLSLTLLSTALAVTEGTMYGWYNDQVIKVKSVSTKPMFAPANMTDDQYPIAIELTVPDVIWEDENLYHELYGQAKLVDKNGVSYAPGAATSKDQILTLLFAVDKGIDVDELSLQFITETASGILEEYIGKWAGTSGDISLIFEISADSRAMFTFTQGNYTDANDVALSVEDGTFTVEVPEDDPLGSVACGGTFSYQNGVLTVSIENTFANGRVFSYTVHCERVE